MAVTKQIYTAAATWTAATLATTFRSAFIDAGLMTDWYDSFTNTGIENRVLEIQHNGSATYGKTYYWFMFTTSGIFVTLATGWNATTHVPTGTQYLDYFTNVTNSTTNHIAVMSTISTTSLTVTRYSSGVTAGFAYFLVQNGSSNLTFSISRAATPLQSWVDLNKSFFHYFYKVFPTNISTSSSISFGNFGGLRRSFYLGSVMGTSVASTYYVNGTSVNGTGATCRYTFPGYSVNAAANAGTDGTTGYGGIYLPYQLTSVNPAFATNSVPVYTNLPYHPLITETLPSDFGIVASINNNTMVPGDTFTVSVGTEVWDILSVQAGNNTSYPSAMFVARTT